MGVRDDEGIFQQHILISNSTPNKKLKGRINTRSNTPTNHVNLGPVLEFNHKILQSEEGHKQGTTIITESKQPSKNH
jgi:hypothetical protein